MSIDATSPAAFLNDLLDHDIRVTLIVDDGRQEIGRLIGVDDNAIVLKQSEGTQLIFRHAIAVIETAHVQAEPTRWAWAPVPPIAEDH